MAESLNICIISREFPPDTAFGGIATFSLDTALMLKEKGHEVTVFSQSLSTSYCTEYQGIRLHKIKVPRPFDSYDRLPAFMLAFNAMVMRHVLRSHRQKPFDLIDAPDHLAEGLFASVFTNIPVVTRLHTPYALIVAMGLNNYRRGISSWLINAAEKIALRRSTVLYAPCMDLVKRCDKLFSLGNVPVKIFGYPLDLKMFSAMEKDDYAGPLRILFLGRLEQRKGIETIAEAFPKLWAQYPDIKLTMVGRDTPNIQGFDSARKYLESVFARAGCSDAIDFVDYVQLDRLPEIFRTHDIVWVPSMYDNYPLICLEGMACGKAVVVSDAGGLPEMVQHGETGLVFRTGDAGGLVQQTLALCASPQLRKQLGENARAFCEVECSLDTIYTKTMALYEYAIANKKKRASI